MKSSIAAVNAALNAWTLLVDNASPGVLKFFTGSAPTNTTDPDSGTLLATLTFSATSFGSASGGVSTANAITSGTIGATGTGGYFRIYDGAGNVIAQGTVATSGGDLNGNSLAFVSGETCSISALMITQTQQ